MIQSRVIVKQKPKSLRAISSSSPVSLSLGFQFRKKNCIALSLEKKDSSFEKSMVIIFSYKVTEILGVLSFAR